MAQDDYIRTALRVPPELHRQLHAAAVDAGHSFNAEIIKRISDSFSADPGLIEQTLEAQNGLVQVMAQFVISAVDLAGPQPGLTNEMFQLMKKMAEGVKAGEREAIKEPVESLMLMLMAVNNAPKGYDVKEFVDRVRDEYRAESNAKSLQLADAAASPKNPKPDVPHADGNIRVTRSVTIKDAAGTDKTVQLQTRARRKSGPK